MEVARQRGAFFGRHLRTLDAGDFSCSVSRATVPRESLPEHIHDDAHFILAIDSGYLSRAFSGDDPGAGFDLVYNPAGTVHRDCFIEPGGRYVSISVAADAAPSAGGPAHVGATRAKHLAARILGLCAANARDARLELEEAALGLLHHISAEPFRSMGLPWLRRADELIASSATEQRLSVACLARHLDVHPVYLARAYRRAFGIGPAKAIQRRRVHSAIAMLARDMSLAEIASACGFADQSHLCRSVQAQLRTTPGALRAAFS